VSPAYGGGRYYGGGASVPYSAGRRSPGGLLPFAILPIAALAIFPGIWLAGAYGYHDGNYNYHNSSNNSNESLPILCLCQQYSVCGCDNNTNTTYLDGVIGNGSAESMNASLIRITDVNGTRTAIINGTLPNGTTAAGGSDSAGVKTVSANAGYLVMAAIVGFTVFLW